MREKKYLFEKLFNEDVDKSIKDLLELLLTERISAILQKRKALEDTQKDEQEIRFREWDRIVNEHCPEITKENQEFLDWIVASQGQETEEFYLYGLIDGIRIMQRIMWV